MVDCTLMGQAYLDSYLSEKVMQFVTIAMRVCGEPISKVTLS